MNKGTPIPYRITPATRELWYLTLHEMPGMHSRYPYSRIRQTSRQKQTPT